MKKTVYAMAAILLSLGFAACSEDDDEKDVFDIFYRIIGVFHYIMQ